MLLPCAERGPQSTVFASRGRVRRTKGQPSGRHYCPGGTFQGTTAEVAHSSVLAHRGLVTLGGGPHQRSLAVLVCGGGARTRGEQRAQHLGQGVGAGAGSGCRFGLGVGLGCGSGSGVGVGLGAEGGGVGKEKGMGIGIELEQRCSAPPCGRGSRQRAVASTRTGLQPRSQHPGHDNTPLRWDRLRYRGWVGG